MSIADILCLEKPAMSRVPLPITKCDDNKKSTLPYPLTEESLSEAWMQLPKGCRTTLESCVAAFKERKISHLDLIAFCRSMTCHSETLCNVFNNSDAQSCRDVSWPRSDSSCSSATTTTSGEAETCNPAKRREMCGHEDESALSKQRRLAPTADDLAAQALIMMGMSEPRVPIQTQYQMLSSALMLPPMRYPHPCMVPASPSSLQVCIPHQQMVNADLQLTAEQLMTNRSPQTAPSSPLQATLPTFSKPCMAKQQVKAPSGMLAASKASKQLRTTPPSVDKSPANSSTSPKGDAATSPKGDAATSTLTPSSDDAGAHNKYCHFCQHVKVKKASSMHACENRGCNRRFCEHCLVTHVQEDPKETAAGKGWHCPICRKTCCCTLKDCGKTHRHCKAYRYRRKRAAQAELADKGAAPPMQIPFAATPGL